MAREPSCSRPDIVARPIDALHFPLGDRAPGEGEVIEVAPSILWARIPLDDILGFINVWILEDGDEFTIVDTGIAGEEAQRAWLGLFSGPLAGRKANRLVVTHFHPDHVGLSAWLCDRFGIGLSMPRTEWLMARLLAMEIEHPLPPEMVGLWRYAGWSQSEVDDELARGWGMMSWAMPRPPAQFEAISAGQILPAGKRQFRLITTRGHSPEHACLWDEAGGILIGGDQVLPHSTSGLSPRPCEVEADPLREWRDSVLLLRDLPDDTLVLPSHDRPFQGLHRRLDQLELIYERRLDRLMAFLDRPRRIVDCFETIFRTPPGPALRQNATGEVLAYLNRLRAEGLVERRIENQVGWFEARSSGRKL